MQLTIFGATGGTGTCLVEQALAAGHDVTAVVRDPARLTVRARAGAGPERLRAVTADVMDPEAITPAVTGADAAVCAVGPRGGGPTTVSADATRSIIAAMHRAGARRLVTVSGSVVADEGDSPYLRFLLKPLVRRTFLRHVCADMRAAEAQVRSSGLDWTIFRPPALTDKPATGTYRLAYGRHLPHQFTVTRADLAAGILELLGNPAAFHTCVAIAN